MKPGIIHSVRKATENSPMPFRVMVRHDHVCVGRSCVNNFVCTRTDAFTINEVYYYQSQ